MTQEIIENKGYWNSRLTVGTPVTGLVRIEWVTSRYGQIIPTNWSMAEVKPWMSTVAPLRFLVADAQNIIVQKAIENGSEWLFLIEQDNVLPHDCFVQMNEYMVSGKIPVVSGLYFTKSVPPEPMVYRGVGRGHYDKWKLGDKVWCDGIPTGTLLIHMSIIKAMYEDAPEYKAGDMTVRRVFETPAKVWYDKDTGALNWEAGTSDLNWCRRVIDGNYFEKTGWSKYQKMQYPFLVDTNIFVKHIDNSGREWPLELPIKYKPDEPKNKRKRRG